MVRIAREYSVYAELIKTLPGMGITYKKMRPPGSTGFIPRPAGLLKVPPLCLKMVCSQLGRQPLLGATDVRSSSVQVRSVRTSLA